MVSLIAAPNQLRLSRPSFLSVNSSAVFFVSFADRAKRNQTSLKRGGRFLGFVRRCKRSESEDYSALEQEVLEFMLQSEDPDRFPSRKELIAAGKRDLAEAVVKRGGWMTRGWDLASDDESEREELDAVLTKWSSVSARVGEDEGKQGFVINGAHSSEVSSAGLKTIGVGKRLEGSSAELGSINGSATSQDSSHPSASSSGRSGETEADPDAGIEGILNRLEKQRNWSLGLHVESKGNTLISNENSGVLDVADSCPRKNSEVELSPGNNTVATQDKLHSDTRNAKSAKSMSNLYGSRSSLKPDTWRTWSIQRAGFSDSDFEAAEINFEESSKGGAPEDSTDQVIALKKEPSGMTKDSEPNTIYSAAVIKSRLQDLGLELSSALRLLRSNSDDLSRKVDRERLSEDFRNLSDAWEFKENEVMNAQDKLRSLRARFAVLEGKVALTKIESRKAMDEKQKRIKDARKALQLLRTTCVIWPNSASEVLLTGSFDGWATQRKMEKSSNGLFSLLLRLYPGKYEIKFIVDGQWRIDPLRPIVKNNGHENNLLIVA